MKRGINLSLATCLTLVLASSLVGALFLGRDIVDYLVEEAKKKADVSIYLQKDCETKEALELRERLKSLPEVEKVEMKTRKEALDEFVGRHSENESLMASLSEVGSNPFLASLSVRAREAEDFGEVTAFLKNENRAGLVEKVDWHKRKSVIEKIFVFSRFVKRGGLAATGIFIAASVIITFTTIRLAVKTREDEISIMRLVGGSKALVQGPYIFQALILGLVAFVLSFLLLGLVSYLLTPKISVFFPGFRVFSFFRAGWLKIALVQLAASLLLVLIPTFFAIRRYLEV